MRKMTFIVLVAMAVVSAAACQNNPAGPKLASVMPGSTESKDSGSEAATSISASSLMGTWRATKALGWNSVPKGSGWSEVPGSRQDLVAAGGTVTLALVPNDQPLGLLIPPGRYTITVAMPGKNPGVDTGFWTFGPAWQEKNKGFYQMDFWPASLGPEPGYGEIPAFLVTLSGDSLKLWDSGLTFLPFNFGEGCTSLELEFIRQ